MNNLLFLEWDTGSMVLDMSMYFPEKYLQSDFKVLLGIVKISRNPGEALLKIISFLEDEIPRVKKLKVEGLTEEEREMLTDEEQAETLRERKWELMCRKRAYPSFLKKARALYDKQKAR